MRGQVIIALKHLREFGPNECKTVEGFKGLTWTCEQTSFTGAFAVLTHGRKMGETMGASRNGRTIPRISGNRPRNPRSWPRKVFFNKRTCEFQGSRKFTQVHAKTPSFRVFFTQVHESSRAPPPPQKKKKEQKKSTTSLKTKSGGASPEIS